MNPLPLLNTALLFARASPEQYAKINTMVVESLQEATRAMPEIMESLRAVQKLSAEKKMGWQLRAARRGRHIKQFIAVRT